MLRLQPDGANAGKDRQLVAPGTGSVDDPIGQDHVRAQGHPPGGADLGELGDRRRQPHLAAQPAHGGDVRLVQAGHVDVRGTRLPDRGRRARRSQRRTDVGDLLVAEQPDRGHQLLAPRRLGLDPGDVLRPPDLQEAPRGQQRAVQPRRLLEAGA